MIIIIKVIVVINNNNNNKNTLFHIHVIEEMRKSRRALKAPVASF